MPTGQRQACLVFAAEKPNTQNLERLGDLCDARGLHHRRAALPLREPRGFVLVGIHAAELLAVRIIHANQKMMVFAPAVFTEGSLPSSGVSFRPVLGHVGHPCLLRISTALSQGLECRTSTGEDSSTRFITDIKVSSRTGNRRPLGGEECRCFSPALALPLPGNPGADGNNEDSWRGIQSESAIRVVPLRPPAVQFVGKTCCRP
jgi:hypothetical protein